MKRWLISIMAASSVALACVSLYVRTVPRMNETPGLATDSWRPALRSVTTLERAYQITNTYIVKQSGTPEERKALGVTRFVVDRFAHGLPTNFIQENWVSRLVGLLRPSLAAPMSPETVLEHESAMCSQQAIVAQALLHHYGIHYASVRASWPSRDPLNQGHFAFAARVDGVWRYYDTDLEPVQQGEPIGGIVDGSSIDKVYANRPILAAEMKGAAKLGHVNMTQIDQTPAPRGVLFQHISRFLSGWGWLIASTLTMVLWAITRRQREGRTSSQKFGDPSCKGS